MKADTLDAVMGIGVMLVVVLIVAGVIWGATSSAAASAKFTQDCVALGGILLQPDVCVDENLKVILTR